MRYQQLLERIKNLDHHDTNQRRLYADQVWHMLQHAYKEIGGFLSAANVDELTETPGLWKITTRKDHVSAVVIYKESHGRKLIGAATDGTSEGKNGLMMILREDRDLKRSWAEVSGRMEGLYRKMGAQPIPNSESHRLTGKRILDLDDDGIHYTRLIAGHPHVKALYGNPKG
jgi:hypothetical protein